MRVCLKKIKITRAAFFLAISAAAFEAAAGEAWTPRVGPLTCEQETEIEMLSQDLALSEYRTASINGETVYVFDAKAKFSLRNSSSAKKKPTVLLPLCSLTPGITDPKLCDVDSFGLKITVDDRLLSDFQTVRQGRTVFVRFPVKFSAKMRREVIATYRLPERVLSRKSAKKRMPYKAFEYHLSDSVKWKGKVRFSRVSVKMPYKATLLNTHLFAAQKPFRYKNRIAFLEKRRFDFENAEDLTFFVLSPSFQDKVRAFRKKVRALPRMVKRRLRLIHLLAEYPGGFSDAAEHLDIVLRIEKKEWPPSTRKHAVYFYTRFLNETLRFEERGVRCEETLCIERDTAARVFEVLCNKKDACIKEHTTLFESCCAQAPQTAVSSASEPSTPSVSAAVERARASKPKQSSSVPPRDKPKETFLSKYLEYFVAHWPIFLAVLIVMGWIGIASRSKNKHKMKELE